MTTDRLTRDSANGPSPWSRQAPDCPTCGYPTDRASAHDASGACTYACDECDHPSAAHANGHQYRDLGYHVGAQLIFEHPTCWRENICAACDPARYAELPVLA